jgi:N-acyl-D-aspartate/D-glutamate deacylase
MSELDLLIAGGSVVDGTGAPARVANVGVKDGRIAYIGAESPAAARTIDATGRYVTPGFIDIHTHYDAQLTWDPWAAPHSTHGVTTYICGNCGFTLAPLTDKSLEYLVPMLAKVEGIPLETLLQGANINWRTTSQMLASFDGKVGVNVGFMTGHSTLRSYVMDDRAVHGTPTADELEQMKGLLRQALTEGSLGFSSSHAETHTDHHADHVPSCYASHEEVLALASVLKDFPGTMAGYVATVLRNPTREDAVKMAEISLAAGRPYCWPGIFPNQMPREKQVEKLGSVDIAREMGADVRLQCQSAPMFLHMNFLTGHTFDQMPGIWPELYALAPAARTERFRDPQTRRRMETDAASLAGSALGYAIMWDKYLIVSVVSEANRGFAGRLVGDIAKELGKSPFDALMDIVVEDGLATLLIPSTTLDESERAWRELVDYIRDERTVWGADDGGAHLDMIEAYSHGTRFLEHAVRNLGLISIEETVNIFTKRQADFIGLKDRGVLAVGKHADILVIDLEKIGVTVPEMRADLPANGKRLYTEARGFDFVIVNGAPILDHGTYTKALPGRVFRAGVDTYTTNIGRAVELTGARAA